MKHFFVMLPLQRMLINKHPKFTQDIIFSNKNTITSLFYYTDRKEK